MAGSGIVLDCSDNFATRHAINRACVAHRKPLVSGAGVRFDGQVAVFDLRDAQSPCYHCLFPEHGDNEDMRCAVMGVFAPLVGIIGTTQAAEALKLVAGIGESLNGRLLLLDALAMEWRTVRLKRDPACAVVRSALRLNLVRHRVAGGCCAGCSDARRAHLPPGEAQEHLDRGKALSEAGQHAEAAEAMARADRPQARLC